MKRILIFVGLKVAEIVGAILVITIVSGWLYLALMLFEDGKYGLACLVMFGPCAATIGVMVIPKLIFNWLRWNWNKAKELAERWR